MSKKTFIAAGDIFITRRIPKEGYEGFDQIRDLIDSHDVKFANLEMTFHNQEGVPAVVSGGTWAMADPCMLDDIQRYGFNIYNTANNHSGDYSYGGVLATIKHLRERDMIFSGTGKVTQVQLHPISLGMKSPRSQKGVPVLSGDEEVLRYLQKLSELYGTKINIADGMGTIAVEG